MRRAVNLQSPILHSVVLSYIESTGITLPFTPYKRKDKNMRVFRKDLYRKLKQNEFNKLKHNFTNINT